MLKANVIGTSLDNIIAGLCMGVSLLIEPVIIVLVFSFFVWSCLKYDISKTIKKYLIMIIIAIGIITPWTIRNYIVHDRLIFIKSSFGYEFWIGNNPHATGTATGISSDYPPLCGPKFDNHTEIECNQMMLYESLKWIKNNPGNFMVLSLKKVFYFWWYPPASILPQDEGDASVKYDVPKKSILDPFSHFPNHWILFFYQE